MYNWVNTVLSICTVAQSNLNWSSKYVWYKLRYGLMVLTTYLWKLDAIHTVFLQLWISKKGTFQFCVSGLLGIHKNPNWKEFLKCCESFLRQSSVCTLTYLNPGFGGPWDMLGIFFVNIKFITLHRSLLENFFFEFHVRVQKCHFGNFSFLAKWHFWTRAWNSKFILAKSILLEHYENVNEKIFS